MVKPPIQSTFKLVKSVFSSKENRPKIPRKKLELQYKKAIERLQQQVEQLEKFLEDPTIKPLQLETGKQLYTDSLRFINQRLYQINQTRFQNLTSQLIHPVDFSMFVLYRMYSLTEEIFHFIHTAEMVEL